jgi:hypothetical protein
MTRLLFLTIAVRIAAAATATVTSGSIHALVILAESPLLIAPAIVDRISGAVTPVGSGVTIPGLSDSVCVASYNPLSPSYYCTSLFGPQRRLK